jgi:release factor glutamine methyltransferase
MPQSIRSVLSRAKSLLRAHGIDTPGLDAEILLSRATELSRTDLIIHRERLLPEREIDVFESFLSRRLMREPIAYILGEKEFFGRVFQVNPKVLIPRPETEALLELALSDAPKGGTVLEIGVGSGAVIVSLLCERSDLRGFGTDISIDAATVARHNARSHGVSHRLHLCVADVFRGLKEIFPVILANPPYVAREGAHCLDEDVIGHEPHRALFGGKDGLDIVKEIIKEAPGHLARGGLLIMEVGLGQARAVDRMVSRREGLQVRCWVNDLAGIPRTVVMERTHG